ncbi:MAG: YdhR family protein [Anaerolineae bacterium]|nr:YdhR family protein [Chloroflexota bacterium]MBN8635286.1 YdhR family protein [Anaerolineae bacterium]
MPQRILQVNFKFNMTRAQYEQFCLSGAPQLVAVPGLLWKVWIMNETSFEAGGIYLFQDASSLQSFVSALTGMLSAPEFTDVSIKPFDILDELTQITHGPIRRTAEI